jgi:hypothetical protein
MAIHCSSRTRRSNQEKYFSPRVISFFEVGYWHRQNARLKYRLLINNKLFKDLLELLSLLEARVMAQPSNTNKVDFDVRKVLKRKEVSRDCMTLSEHGEFCIKGCKISCDVCFMRLFPAAKITSLLRTPRIQG